MAKQTIEVEPVAASMDPGVLSLVIALANRSYQRVPMTEIEFKREGVSTPPLYKYSLKAGDRRVCGVPPAAGHADQDGRRPRAHVVQGRLE